MDVYKKSDVGKYVTRQTDKIATKVAGAGRATSAAVATSAVKAKTAVKTGATTVATSAVKAKTAVKTGATTVATGTKTAVKTGATAVKKYVHDYIDVFNDNSKEKETAVKTGADKVAAAGYVSHAYLMPYEALICSLLRYTDASNILGEAKYEKVLKQCEYARKQGGYKESSAKPACCKPSKKEP